MIDAQPMAATACLYDRSRTHKLVCYVFL